MKAKTAGICQRTGEPYKAGADVYPFNPNTLSSYGKWCTYPTHAEILPALRLEVGYYGGYVANKPLNRELRQRVIEIAPVIQSIPASSVRAVEKALGVLPENMVPEAELNARIQQDGEPLSDVWDFDQEFTDSFLAEVLGQDN